MKANLRKRVVALFLILVYICLMLCFLGCDKRKVQENRKLSRIESHRVFFLDLVKYIQDERTGLCFVFASGWEYFKIVPCEKFKELGKTELLVIKKQSTEDPQQQASRSP